MTDNIHPILGDSIEYIKTTDKTYDFVYIDPPWGGPEYKDKKKVTLEMSNTDVHDIIDMILENNITKLILLKGPTNFNYKEKYKTNYYSFLTPSKRVSYNIFVIRKN